MQKKKCPICNYVYPSNLPACPHCKESNLGYDEAKSKGTRHASHHHHRYAVGSYEKDLRVYSQQKRIMRMLVVLLFLCSLAFVVWSLLVAL